MPGFNFQLLISLSAVILVLVASYTGMFFLTLTLTFFSNAASLRYSCLRFLILFIIVNYHTFTDSWLPVCSKSGKRVDCRGGG